MTADRRTIVISPHARDLRRRLGPTAWVVLEELISTSTQDRVGCHSTATVRSLAADLGLAKDTVAARALTRLSAAGLVGVEQCRTPAGTFGPGSYRITIPAGITLVQSEPSTPTPTRPRAARPTGSQLALCLDG